MEDKGSMTSKGVRLAVDEVPLDHWQDPACGNVSWRTLISGDRTPSDTLVCGVAYFGPDGELKAHRHVPSEVVHVIKGYGKAIIDDIEYPMAPGDTLFIPANIVHSFSACGGEMQIFYVFGVDRFDQVEYVFDSPARSSRL